MDSNPARHILNAATLLLAMSLVPQARANLQVRIDSGIVEGVATGDAGIRAFKGIPFAAPPLGDLRWKAPQPVASWDGARKADAFGPRPMQAPVFSDMIFRDKGPSEDCLYLNVWTPAKSDSERLPVMVWIFGGGLQAGSTSEPRQDGENLAKKGVVIVSMNYRLGVFGFMAHPELSRESGHAASGDYGFMDQVAALQWVQRNIAAFGGDPANVTIFGESAGSESVSVLMASPMAKGLFQKAIGESGAFLGSKAIPAHDVSLADVEAKGADLAAAVGAKSLAELRAVPADAVLRAAQANRAFRFGAIVDGNFLPEDPDRIYAEGRQAHVPLLAGWNADEMRVYAVFGANRPTAKGFGEDVTAKYGRLATPLLKLYPAGADNEAVRSAGDLAGDRFIAFGTWKWIDMHSKTGGSPVFRYSFDRKVPIAPGRVINGSPATGEDVGAVHASEIVYVFGALASEKNVPWQPADYELSDAMGTYWTNFAKRGNPNSPGYARWPSYDKATGYPVMHLDSTQESAPEAHRDRYEFWDAPSDP